MTDVQPTDTGTYIVVVGNSYGSVISSNALLTVFPSPIVETQPTSQAVVLGASATFLVTVGGPAVSFQWVFDGAEVQGATNALLTLSNAGFSQAGTYSVIVSNIYGWTASSNAVLTVEIPPGIEVQPQDQAFIPGANTVFSVTASGTALTYQWLLNSSPIPGQTNSALVLSNINQGSPGQYSVLISNAVGVVTSSPAMLLSLNGGAYLDPLTFAAIGVFNPASNVVINTSTGQMSGGANFEGVETMEAGIPVVVFCFSSFNLSPGVNITFATGTGSPAVAFLSRGDMTIGGRIDADGSGPSGVSVGPGSGGIGGGGGSAWSGGMGGGGGGGHVGAGGEGEQGGAGGASYDLDITGQLDGGSPGGAGGQFPGASGGGGGAIQLGALGSLVVSGSVSANGGEGTDGVSGGCSGGGSGGALLLQAGKVTIATNASLSADGGMGGGPYGKGNPYLPAGGGGGGGIVIAYSASGTSDGTITAAGGEGWVNGQAGTVEFVQDALVRSLPGITGSMDASGNLVLSWPLRAGNYELQTSATLGADGVWTPVAGAGVVGNNYVLTVPPLGTACFFRLLTQ